MRVVLEEHDAMLRSYRAQKYGDGDGIEAKPGQLPRGRQQTDSSVARGTR